MNDEYPDKKNETLEAALKALERGLHPIPVEENGKYALVPWEKYKDTRPTREEVIEWFTKWPAANLGIIIGTFFGVMALELEYGHDPWPPPGREFNSPCIVEAPGGALYYCFSIGFKIRNNHGDLARGVNILGDDGYVLIPPSRIDGIPYSYEKGSVGEGSVCLLPLWLEKRLKAIKSKQSAKIIFDGCGKRIIRKGRMRQHDLDQAKKSDFLNFTSRPEDMLLTDEDF